MAISFQPEYIFRIFGFSVTNSFFTSVLVTVILVVISIILYFSKSGKNFILNSLKVLILEILKFIDLITHDREFSKKIMPLVATFFIFIVTANTLELIPGFLGAAYVKTSQGIVPLLRSPNSDLTTTLALALFSVFSIQLFSIRALGIKKYLLRFFNFVSPTKFVVGFFELISEVVKILSFSMRLFGNIFAGEVLLFVIAFLVPYILPVPFMILELFVGILQAFIFAMLTLAFIKTSIMRRLAS